MLGSTRLLTILYMIKLKDLTAGYARRKPVLTKLNTELRTGQIYGLLGANGSGKTTLLYTISGCITPLAGEVEVLSVTPSSRSREMLQELIFMPDEVELPAISAESFVNDYSTFRPRFDKEKFQRILERFDFTHNLKLNKLSLGNRKKFFIAFALASNAKIVLFDEPTNGLDITSKVTFRQVLAEEINDERLFIISTHLVSDIEQLLSSIIVIKDKQIVVQASMDTVAERLTFGATASISQPLFSEGLRAVGKGEGDYSNVDLELLYLALHNPTSQQPIIDILSGKEELC